jgi:hypothetical protein
MKIKLLTRCRCSRFVEINYKSPFESDEYRIPLAPRSVPAEWPVEDHPAMPIHVRTFVFHGAYDDESGVPIYCEAES